jgi:purine-binding chemotaxis protein CheW
MNQPKDAPSARQGQYLSFELGGELYAVDILKVQEIRGWEPVRPLPNTPCHVKGVLDLRGVIVPIVDLRIRFGLNPGAYTPTTVIIVLAVHQDDQPLIMGVVVDSVSDVLDVAAKEIRQPPRMGGHIDYRYLIGMVSRQDHMVVLLDSDRLLAAEELESLKAEL